MYRNPYIFLFVIIQIGLMIFGLYTNPILIIGLPIAFTIFFLLIYYPFISLLLLAMTGIIKGFLISIAPIFEVVDYTILITVIIWIGLFRYYLIGKIDFPKWSFQLFGIFTIFCSILLISGFYTPSPQYGWQKIIRFIIFNSTMFIAPFVLINSSEDSKQILLWFRNILVVFVITMSVYIFYYLSVSSGLSFLIRASMLGANPIDVASFLAIAAGMTIVLMIRSKLNRWIIYFPLLAILLIGIIMTGSRGPIMSLLIGAIVYLIMFENKASSKIIWFGIIFIFVLAMVLLFLPENFTTRYLNYTSGDLVIQREGVNRVSTVALRWQYWQLSLREWAQSLKTLIIGVGSGGFSSFYIMRDYQFYPHNMFFEVLLELGILGISVFVAFWVKCVSLFIKFRKEKIVSLASGMWIIALLIRFLGGQFSGDLTGNRIVWMFMALALLSLSYDKFKITSLIDDKSS